MQVPFEGFGKLRNIAIAATSYEWILSLDTNKRCTEAAKKKLLTMIDSPGAWDAYYVTRRDILMGRRITHSGWYPEWASPSSGAAPRSTPTKR